MIVIVSKDEEFLMQCKKSIYFPKVYFMTSKILNFGDILELFFCSQDRRREIIAEYDEEIKQELADIKAAYEKKTQTEKSIRQKLEKEVEYCRLHHTQTKSGDVKKELNTDIKKLLEEKEAKILQLEKELIQVC